MATFLLFSHWALSIDVIGASLYCYLPVLQIGSANTGGSASPSDDSSSDDSSKDGTGSFPVTHDAASIAGSIRSMEARPLHLQKSDSMYSTDESRFSSFSEELEPLVSRTGKFSIASIHICLTGALLPKTPFYIEKPRFYSLHKNVHKHREIATSLDQSLFAFFHKERTCCFNAYFLREVC